MKLSRKLIPAMIMLLVSAVLMSTASFAWFSTNTTAKTEGMSVRVAAATNLLIKDNDPAAAAPYNDYSASVVFGEAAKKTGMDPASAAVIASPEFWVVSDGKDIKPESHKAGANTKFVKDETGDNYLKTSVTLKATGEYGDGATNFGDVRAVITVNRSKTSPIDPALRILITTGDKAYIYAPISGATASYAPITGETKDDVGTEITAYSNDNTAIIEDLVKEVEHVVNIYVWYEGQDAACMANNATDIGDITIAINFTLDPVVGG